MGKVAYADEFPWVRCPCGWTLNGESIECKNCGDTSAVTYLDRFGWNGKDDTVKYGVTYKVVQYEDRYRRLV